MIVAELLLQDFDLEIAGTRRALERVPDDAPHWAPHEKSMKLGKLAMHCATLPLFGSYIVTDPDMDLAAPRHPKIDLTYTDGTHCVQCLDESAAACRAAIAGSSDEHLEAPWRFSFGEHVISNHSRCLSLRQMCLNHLIHHRAQLGVYLRLLGVPVPALYGPSADEQWAPR
jgi:uncharacterized damage-inducible protein DinB